MTEAAMLPSTLGTCLEPVRIVVVGVNWGERMLAELTSPTLSAIFQVVGVCARRRDNAERLAAGRKLNVYDSFDDVLADRAVQAIGLFVGPDVRFELASKAIRAGKDVMTTKPLDLDPDRALLLLREAQRLGRTIHMNSPQPVLAPDLRVIRAWEERYGLGRMISCRGDQWVSYAESADGSWYDDPRSVPVAPIARLGIYVLNDIIQLFGPPRWVSVAHSRIRTGRPTPDNALAVLEFDDGAIGSVFSSFCVDDAEPYRCALTVNYERGSVYRNVGPHTPPGSRTTVQLELVTRNRAGERQVIRETATDGSGTYNWRAFHDCIRGITLDAPLLTPEEHVAGIRTLAALGAAERTGRRIEVLSPADEADDHRESQ